jgi:tRNA(Ile)-lysidine synthase
MYPTIEKFLKKNCTSSNPLLLALSGGPDSLALFYCLLMYRQRANISFHVAHIDHGWREESATEARILKELTQKHEVPFHTNTLNTTAQKGNLEAICRNERYNFFLELHTTFQFDALLTGHHQDDQAETICKRVFEGAHWSRWKGLLPVSEQRGMKIIRPLLSFSKKEISEFFEDSHMHPFQDPTNHELKFLRARFRENIFPVLNQHFEKKIEKNFVYLAEEANELIAYFDEKIDHILPSVQKGPWGIYINLKKNPLQNHVEIKYMLRKIATINDFFLSREIINEIAETIIYEKKPKIFVMGKKIIFIDRQRIFIENSQFSEKNSHSKQEIPLFPGKSQFDYWDVKINEKKFANDCKSTTWEEALQGKIIHYLPAGKKYILTSLVPTSKEHENMKEKCRSMKIPLFLLSRFPFIDCFEGSYVEFLTGEPGRKVKEGEDCWRVELSVSERFL